MSVQRNETLARVRVLRVISAADEATTATSGMRTTSQSSSDTCTNPKIASILIDCWSQVPYASARLVTGFVRCFIDERASPEMKALADYRVG